MKTVGIVGAGIGGLTLANLLSGQGWTVEVFERASGLPSKGSALGMWPDAMEVFSEIDVAEAIRRAGHPQSAAEVRGPSGRLLKHIPARGETVMISRVALLEALYTEGLTVHFDSEIVDPTQLNHDVIIGADGINSSIRTFVVGTEVHTRDLHVGVILGQFDGTTDMFTEYWGPGRSFGITPLSSARRDWHAAYRAPRQGTSAAALELDDPLRFVAESYQSWNDDVSAAIAATIDDSVTHYHVRTTPRLRRWHRDNVVLIGDAVHAMAPNLGRGACETILDAAALSKALVALHQNNETDRLPAAFAKYQRQRRGPAHRIASASRIMCRAGMLERGAALRNLAMRISP